MFPAGGAGRFGRFAALEKEFLAGLEPPAGMRVLG